MYGWWRCGMALNCLMNLKINGYLHFSDRHLRRSGKKALKPPVRFEGFDKTFDVSFFISWRLIHPPVSKRRRYPLCPRDYAYRCSECI